MQFPMFQGMLCSQVISLYIYIYIFFLFSWLSLAQIYFCVPANKCLKGFDICTLLTRPLFWALFGGVGSDIVGTISISLVGTIFHSDSGIVHNFGRVHSLGGSLGQSQKLLTCYAFFMPPLFCQRIPAFWTQHLG